MQLFSFCSPDRGLEVGIHEFVSFTVCGLTIGVHCLSPYLCLTNFYVVGACHAPLRVFERSGWGRLN
jgi:hypothetical protein